MNVTLFRTIKETKDGVDVKIDGVFKAISDGQWSQHVEYVREGQTKEDRAQRKKAVPYFTASGTFAHRKEDGLKKHSGIIAIDFDNLEDTNDVKSFLALDRYSWYTCESISGHGLCVFVKIDGEKHLESFNYLAEYYQKNYNLEIDQACKDVSRARFVMYDPDAVLNDAAVRLVLEKEKQFDPERIIGIAENMIRTATDGKRHNELLKAARLMGGYIGSGLLDENTVSNRLSSVWLEREYDTSYNYETTIKDGISYGTAYPITFEHYQATTLKAADDKKQIAIIYATAREINRSGRSFDVHDMRDLHKTGISERSIETIFNKVFDEEKHLFGFDDMPKPLKMELTVGEKWEFRKNVVLGSTDYRVKANRLSIFERVNYDTVTRYALHCGQMTSVDKVRSLLRSDFVEEYDPLKSYFLNLEKWDGKTDYIENYANSIQTKDQDFFLSMFKKHLVRSVDQIINDVVNRFVFVLVGEKQATGKSTWIRTLSPFPKGQYYTESKIRDDKDGEFSFAENFIYNIEELAGMSKGDTNRLKAIISQSVVKERRAYTAEVESMSRRCTFFGSTNDGDFLTDIENTRWLCHEVTSINWDYSKIDINSVWSQAFALLNDPKFNKNLDEYEVEVQRGSNKGYEVTTEATELLQQHFEPAVKETIYSYFATATEILLKIDIIVGGAIRFKKHEIIQALKSLGFEQTKTRVNGILTRGYYITQKSV